MRFLDSLEIPFVATLRDTQNYVQAHREGRGIHELKPWRVREDMQSWEPLIAWLDGRTPRPMPRVG
jgi:chromosome partitioning protein